VSRPGGDAGGPLPAVAAGRSSRPTDGLTVVAPATAVGRAAVAMVRLSGPEAGPIARALCPGGPPWRSRRAALRALYDGDSLIDEGLVLWMPGPATYTGEDTVELSIHGNPLLVERVVDRCVALGARPARPGELTRRAVEHGRMDLLRAEAVGSLIEARTEAGLAIARAGLSGGLGRLSLALRERLLDLCAELEARFDAPGEDLDLLPDAVVAERLAALAAEAQALAGTWRAGRRLLQGARVALIGPVNAGKSSLFNHLLGERRALVSPMPGTTRDVVEARLLLDGLEITLQDTAGEREIGLDDTVFAAELGLEAEGIELGRALTLGADLTLVVLPLHRPVDLEALLARTAHQPRILVGTHQDCALPSPPPVEVALSNRSGEGIDTLRGAISRALREGAAPAGVALLHSQRQHDLLLGIADHTSAARGALLGHLGPVVAAMELSRALDRLAELDGHDVREAVLDRVFARFCIGK
jgi:tRNA modification GTPase